MTLTSERPCNAIELAFHNLTPAVSRLSLAAKGRADMINPDKVLEQAADLRARLAVLEAAAKAEKRARAEAAKARAKAERERLKAQPKPKLVVSNAAATTGAVEPTALAA